MYDINDCHPPEKASKFVKNISLVEDHNMYIYICYPKGRALEHICQVYLLKKKTAEVKIFEKNLQAFCVSVKQIA